MSKTQGRLSEKQSKKHHYIPQFYLKGFTDKDSSYYVFDKRANKCWKSSPENSFAENHRNTGEIKHQVTGEIGRSDIPEIMLAHFDNRTAPIIELIRNSKPQDHVLTPERLYILRFFIFSLFWRSPANDELREEIIEKYPLPKLGLRYVDAAGKPNPEFEQLMKEIDLFTKLYPAILPLVSFQKKYARNNDNEWKIYYRKEEFHVVTDNPILHSGFRDFSSLHEELIFPISSKVLLVSTKKYKPHILAPLFTLNVDLLLFHKSGRYVASCNRDYLMFLADQSKQFLSKPGWEHKLQEQIFNAFY
ncbi:MAG: DUF4238 domain-containing protein [Flavisolibacter sp.]|nr:DUF4238 domain-containing protein [Flavisolibacter sp.]